MYLSLKYLFTLRAHYMTQRFTRHSPHSIALVCALLACVSSLTGGAAMASQNRVLLIDQSKDDPKQGFSLRLENQTAGDAVCTPATLKLAFALGDGGAWHYLVSPVGGWRMNRDYVAKAEVDSRKTELFIDDALISSGEAVKVAPARQAAEADMQQDWASDPADYFVVVRSVRVTVGDGKTVAATLPARSVPTMLLGDAFGRQVPGVAIVPGLPFTVEATFRLVPRPMDLKALGPMFDATGQAIASRWPGQSLTNVDFQRDRRREAQQLAEWSATDSAAYDSYGGWRGAGWHGAPSAAFRVALHNGKWWLVTPDGNPCFYRAIDTAPSLEWEKTPVTGRESLFAALPPHGGQDASAWEVNPWGQDPGIDYVSFCAVNLMSKYGADWQAAFDRVTKRRLRVWGFSGMGKWSQPIAGVCDWPVLSRGDVPALAGHPDPFDPATQVALQKSLTAQITPRLQDKTVVAWTLGNEIDEIVKASEIKAILAMGADVPAKRALLDNAVDVIYGGDLARLDAAWSVTPASPSRGALYADRELNPSPADLEKLREFYEDRYYALIYKTVKLIDPNHLYAGFWIVPGWWENDSDWSIIGAHCDLIGYDRYSFQFTDAKLAAQMRKTDKPVFCGEFSFPPTYDGARGFGLYGQAFSLDDADAGRWYAKTIRAAAANPYCVGVGWFQYRDEPQSGRGPGHGPELVYGEHYAFGAVTIADQPKWDLITAMRAANGVADKLRSSNP